MNICIFGYGFVGKAHYELLSKDHSLNIVDPAYPDLAKTNFQPDCAIICVSTPAHSDGSCNINNVYECIESLPKNIPILIKSTISLEGWTFLTETFPDHILNFSPEFLRAATYLDDIKTLDYMYLSENQPDFWANLFNPYYTDIKFVIAKAEELILVKYFRNSFLATKVNFFNQVYDLCEAAGLRYEEIAAGITADYRIGTSHSEVTQERGFGGHCFPKDVQAIIRTAEKNNIDLSIIKEAFEYNKRIRNK